MRDLPKAVHRPPDHQENTPHYHEKKEMIYFFEWILALLGFYVCLIFSDLLILLIRYRKDSDNWEYPIDMTRFREWVKKKKDEK